jgi:hypothetical protein
VIRSKKSSKLEFRFFVGEGRDKNGVEPQQSTGRDHNAGVRNIASLNRVAVGGYPGICRRYLR